MSGYIHPDQWFQGLEALAAWSCAYQQAFVAWEFANCTTPARSWMSALTSSWPTLLTHNPIQAVYAVHAWCALCTSITALALIRLGRIHLPTASSSFLPSLLLTTWPLVVLGSRPLSNTAELWVLVAAWCAWHAVKGSPAGARPARDFLSSSLLTSLCIVGIFIRFTFLVFILPTAWAWGCWVMGWGKGKREREGKGKGADAMVSKRQGERANFMLQLQSWASPTLHLLSRTWPSLLGAVLGTACTACVCIGVDSVMFGAARLQWEVGAWVPTWTWAIWPPPLAPAYSLLYNLDPHNLAKHGAHPRVLHTLVNGPMLYGPAWIAGLGYAGWCVWTWARKSRAVDWPWVLQALTLHVHGPPSAHLHALAVGTWIIGLAALSTAPHQEPRFLLPLAPSVCIITACLLDRMTSTTPSPTATTPHKPVSPRVSRLITLAWLVFNGAVGGFFGLLHQAGVVPGALHLASFHRIHFPAPTSTLHTVWYGTYMPPRAMVGGMRRSARGEGGRCGGDMAWGVWHAAPWCTPGHAFNLVHADGAIEHIPSPSTTVGHAHDHAHAHAHDHAQVQGVLIHDVGSQDGRELVDKLWQLQEGIGPQERIAVIAPGSLRSQVHYAMHHVCPSSSHPTMPHSKGHGIHQQEGGDRMKRYTIAWPHVSTEAWPQSLDEAVLDAWVLPQSCGQPGPLPTRIGGGGARGHADSEGQE